MESNVNDFVAKNCVLFKIMVLGGLFFIAIYVEIGLLYIETMGYEIGVWEN